MIKQCRFIDDDKMVCGGILCDFDNGDKYIIDGCCGRIFDPNKVEIIQVYDSWVSLSNEIMGE